MFFFVLLFFCCNAVPQIQQIMMDCALCTYSTNRADNYRRHMRYHLGVKPFSCSVCAAAFVTKHDLVCHERHHSGERPFACGSCDRMFARRNNLAAHCLIVHKIKRAGTSRTKRLPKKTLPQPTLLPLPVIMPVSVGFVHIPVTRKCSP